MSGVLETIGEIIWTLISEGVKTVWKLGGLFVKLLKFLSPVSASGPWGFIAAVLIITATIYIIGKFAFHIGRNTILLLIFGLIAFLAAIASII